MTAPGTGLRALAALFAFTCLMQGCSRTAAPPPSDRVVVYPPPAAPRPAPPPPPPAPPPSPAPPAPVPEKLSASADAFFAAGSTTLNANAKASLDELAAKTHGQTVEVIIAVGHASAGEAASADGVQRLSVQRAEAVKSYLVEQGVEKNRVYAEGKGARQPVADDTTAEGRARNRRVEVELVGARARPVRARRAAPSVVYNADLAPQLPRDAAAPQRAVLKAGVAATLSFDIGPKSASSLLSDIAPAPDIVDSPVDLPLTVVLACGFCEPQADALKRLTFRPGEGRSDVARFRFTPRRQPDGSGYVGRLSLAVINDQTGREYDRLSLPVAIAGDGAPGVGGAASAASAAGADGASGTATVLAPSPGVDSSDWRPDLLLYATVAAQRNVLLEFQPVSAAMKQRLGPLALDAQGRRRVFRSGIDDAQLVDAMANSAYGAMSALSLQGDFLKQLSATGVDAAVSRPSQATLKLTDAESAKVAEVIARSGQGLYRHLFTNSADGDLRQLVAQLEAAAAAAPPDRPLRLMVVTDRLSLPWQYLHPVGPQVDASRFWGLQFSLSVLRVNNQAREKSVARHAGDTRQVLFAHYGSRADPTVALARDQARQLLKLPLAEADLLQVDTGKALLAQVSARRKTLSGIVTFLHASAGAGDLPPNLQFNDGDVVTSDSLENLLNKVSQEEQGQRYLAEGPLVILNACETGPARQLPHVKLQNALFELGAQGVVVTEVSVWISLGHEVATQLIARLVQGEPVADALTAVRRRLQAEKRNPLGLLYVYYGDPAATLRR